MEHSTSMKREVTRGIIIALHQEGYERATIARKVKCARNCVCYTIRKWKRTGRIDDLERSGRPRTTTATDDQRIVILSKRNRRFSAPSIAKVISSTLQKNVSTATVKRRLSDAGLNGYVAASNPLSTEKNRKRRLQRSKTHQSCTATCGKALTVQGPLDIPRDMLSSKMLYGRTWEGQADISNTRSSFLFT